MSNSKQNITQEHLSTSQIKAYLDGTLSPKEMHAVEAHMLDCPFCTDALEGYQHITRSQANKMLNEISETLKKKTQVAVPKNSFIKYAAIAASLAILVVISYVGTNLFLGSKQQQSNKISQNLEKNDNDRVSSKEEIQTPTKEHIPSTDETLSEENKKETNTIIPASEEVLSNESEDKNSQSKLEKTDAMESNLAAAARQKDTDDEVGYQEKELIMAEAQPDYSIMSQEDEKRRSQTKEESVESDAMIYQNSGKPVSVSQLPYTIIKGKVYDQEGKAAPGIKVRVKGIDEFTYTDLNGYYTIQVPLRNEALVFTGLGYLDKEVQIKDQLQIDVKLAYDKYAFNQDLIAAKSKKRKASKNKRDRYTAEKYSQDLDEKSTSPQQEAQQPVTKSYPENGYTQYAQYIASNANYPKDAFEKNIGGTVSISFWINTDATLTNFKVTKSIEYGCDKEVIRLIKTGPKWRNVTSKSQEITISVFFDANKKTISLVQ